MAELNDTDLLLVNRNETAATIQSSELMASLEETDYMLVNRNEQTYKITGADLIDSLIDPLELAPVVAPTEAYFGDTLNCTPNPIGGKSPFTFTYAWKYKESETGDVYPLPGDTGTASYTTISADAGYLIACEVTVVDGRGTTVTELSNFTSAIKSPPTVDKPSIIAPADGAGEAMFAESDEIVEVGSEVASFKLYLWNGAYTNAGNTIEGPFPANLQDVLDNGTLVNGSQANVSATQSLIIVPNGTETGKPFLANDSTIYFRMGSSEGLGHFAADGTSLGGSGAFNLNDPTRFNDWESGSIYNTAYYLNRNAAYIILGNAGPTNSTGAGAGSYPTLSDSNTTTVRRLTLAGDKDLTVFQPLDDVQQDSGYTPQTSQLMQTSNLTQRTWSASSGLFDPQLAFNNVLTNWGRAPSGGTIWLKNVTIVGKLEAYFQNITNGPGSVNFLWQTTDGKAETGYLLDAQQANNTWIDIPLPPGWTYPIELSNLGLKSTHGKSYNLNICGIKMDGMVLVDGGVGETVLTFLDAQDFINLRVADAIRQDDDAAQGIIKEIQGNDITLAASQGTWSPLTGNYAIGPDTEPATGTIESIDSNVNTMTLSVSDETYPKRWIVNQGKFVKGEETPSQDAAVDISGQVDVTPTTNEIVNFDSYDPRDEVTGASYSAGYDTDRIFNPDTTDPTKPNYTQVGTFAADDTWQTWTPTDPISCYAIEVACGFQTHTITPTQQYLRLNGSDITTQLPFNSSSKQGVGSSWSAVEARGSSWQTFVLPGGVLTSLSWHGYYTAADSSLQGMNMFGVRIIENNGDAPIPIIIDTTLTLAGDKDLDLLEVGDTIKEGNNQSTEVVMDAIVSGWVGVQTSPENSLVGLDNNQTTDFAEINKAMNVAGLKEAVEAAYATGSSSVVATQSVWGGAYNNRLYSYQAGTGGATEDNVVRYKVTKPGTFYVYIGHSTTWHVSSVAAIQNIVSAGGTFTVTIENAGYANQELPAYTVERIKVTADEAAVGSTFELRPIVGVYYTYYIPVGLVPTGKVGNISGNTITLSESNGTWSANSGTYAIGPVKTIDSTLALYSSAFASTPEGSLSHTTTDWQITLKTDTAYANVVDQSLNNSSDLTSWKPGNLEGDTAYRCRVKHRAGAIESEWSTDSTFKTAAAAAASFPPSDFVVWDGTTATDVTAPVKFINYTANYGDYFAIGVDNNLYKITPAGVVSTMGSFAAALGGGTAVQAFTEYNGKMAILTDNGDVYWFNATNYEPDLGSPLTGVLGQDVAFVTGGGKISKVALAVSNTNQKIWVGTSPFGTGGSAYPGNVTLDGETFSVTGPGMQDCTAAFGHIFTQHNAPIKWMACQNGVDSGNDAYFGLGKSAVLYSDGELWVGKVKVASPRAGETWTAVYLTGFPNNTNPTTQWFHALLSDGSVHAINPDATIAAEEYGPGTSTSPTISWFGTVLEARLDENGDWVSGSTLIYDNDLKVPGNSMAPAICSSGQFSTAPATILLPKM